MINQSINLNLIPGAIPPRIKVSQYDEGSRTLIFMLYNGSSQYAGDTGITAKIQGTKPDGHGFCYDATYGQETGYCYVTADLTRQMTVVAGAVTCEIVLEKNSQVLGTGNFILDVEAGALSDDTDISDTEIPAIIDLAETNAERAEDAADRAEAASAHAPYIGNNDHWYVWDSTNSQYVDSGVDAKGEDGASIVSVTKTSTSGYVDTYTITMSDGTTSTFTVTNGTSTLPGGGMKGQVLTKKSDTTGDADWSSDLELGKVGWDAAASSVKKNILNATLSGVKAVNTAGTWSGNAYTNKGVTFTVATDSRGYITEVSTSGTASEASVFTLVNQNNGNYSIFSKGGIILNGSPEGASNTTYYVELYISSPQNWYRDLTGNGISITLPSAEPSSWNFNITVRSGTDSSGKKFYPMVRPASIKNSDYAPWIPDNTELVPWSANGVLGAKNLFDPNAHTGDNAAVADYSNPASIVVTSAGSAGTYHNSKWVIPCDKNILYRIFAKMVISSGVGFAKIEGSADGTNFTTIAESEHLATSADINMTFWSGNYSYIRITLYCTGYQSETGSVTYKDLIVTLATDTDTTYQPYAMTNRELTTGKVGLCGIIASSSNLNNYKDSGVYAINEAPTNSPAQYGILVVIKRDGNNSNQLFFRSNEMYTRSWNGTWTQWFKYSGTEVV